MLWHDPAGVSYVEEKIQQLYCKSILQSRYSFILDLLKSIGKHLRNYLMDASHQANRSIILNAHCVLPFWNNGRKCIKTFFKVSLFLELLNSLHYLNFDCILTLMGESQSGTIRCRSLISFTTLHRFPHLLFPN